MKPAVIVHTCDKYSYILPEFLEAYKKFNLHKLLTTYITTEEKTFSDNDVINIVTGNGEWSDRLNIACKQIPNEDIMLMQEDFIIQNINLNVINAAFNFHKQFQSHITKLGAFYEFKVYNTGLYCYDLKYPVWIQENSPYMMSHQPIAFFNKSFLMETLKTPYSAWEHECRITEKINNNDYGNIRIYNIGQIHYPNRSDIIDIYHAIRKGQYVKKS